MKRLNIRLKDVLKERDMSQLVLYERLKADGMEIRKAAISEIANNQRRSINREHLERIATALDISDINVLITLLDE